MPSPRAVLHDIVKFELDPNKPHRVIAAGGNLRPSSAQASLLVEALPEVVAVSEEPVDFLPLQSITPVATEVTTLPPAIIDLAPQEEVSSDPEVVDFLPSVETTTSDEVAEVKRPNKRGKKTI